MHSDPARSLSEQSLNANLYADTPFRPSDVCRSDAPALALTVPNRFDFVRQSQFNKSLK